MKVKAAAFSLAAAVLAGCGGSLSTADGGSGTAARGLARRVRPGPAATMGTGGSGGPADAATPFDAAADSARLRAQLEAAASMLGGRQAPSCPIDRRPALDVRASAVVARRRSRSGRHGPTALAVRCTRSCGRRRRVVDAGRWHGDLGRDGQRRSASHATSWTHLRAVDHGTAASPSAASVLARIRGDTLATLVSLAAGVPTALQLVPDGCFDDCLSGIRIAASHARRSSTAASGAARGDGCDRVCGDGCLSPALARAHECSWCAWFWWGGRRVACLAACGGGRKSADVAAPSPTTRTCSRWSSAHCGGCHAPGGFAPFSLTSYDEARGYAALAAAATRIGRDAALAARRPAAATSRTRARCPRTEIAVFAAWDAGGRARRRSDRGAPRRRAGARLSTSARRASRWIRASSYRPDAPTSDDYHCFLVDPGLASAQDLIGFDVHPGTPESVHHVLVFAVPPDAGGRRRRRRTTAEPGIGWTCFAGTGIGSGTDAPPTIGGWVPGVGRRRRFPQARASAWRPGRGSSCRCTTTCSPAPAFADRTTVDLYYAGAPSRSARSCCRSRTTAS